MNDKSLKPDGERFLPEFTGIIELEHYHRYFVAEALVRSKDVLDLASGEGFGSEILSRSARSVVGVDLSSAAVAFSSAKYLRKNLSFLHGSATDIPLGDGSVDVVVSFETIEHLADHDGMMAEICRVLRPDGFVILSSPNKTEYSDKPGYFNPFHIKELYTTDFLHLASRYFKYVCHYGQRVMTASVIAGERANGSFTTFSPAGVTQGVPEQMYDIVIASNSELPAIAASVFELPQGPLQPQKMTALVDELEIAKAELEEAHAALMAVEKDYGAQKVALQLLEADYEATRAALTTLQHELEVQNDAFAKVKQQSKSDEQQIERLSSEVAAQAKQVQGLEKAVAQAEERLAIHQVALNAALRDLRLIVGDKWWKRTDGLRRLDNKIRKLKGKPLKTVPANFHLENYLRLADVHSGAVTLNADVSTVPRVPYSDISEGFVPYEPAEPVTTSPKAIAFYLPQFHPFPENDAWWGKGFTEWTNVGKALPLFRDHYQPHCPIHLGYYDLRVSEVMEEQAKLAREYGVSGFAYYFYWFAGKVLMDRPLQQMLGNPKVDIPFCMIWANENWTRRWDGLENEVLISQKHSLDDSCAMLDYLRLFMEDPRYIKIDGKPLFIIYRADIIPDMAETIRAWRVKAAEFGFPGIYLVCAQTFGLRDPQKFGFDAAMEFPPHTIESTEVSHTVTDLDPTFDGRIYNYDQAVTNAVKQEANGYKVFPTAMFAWDNTARKRNKSHIFTEFSLVRYSQWLSSNAERVAKNPHFGADERLIFINAWNEWAEGTHLEPDQKHGYGYLAATRAVMQNYALAGADFLRPIFPETPGSEIALIVHLHYEETWSDILCGMQRLLRFNPDVYVTVTSLRLAQMVKADLPAAIIEMVDNRGRDIRPFLITLAKIRHLRYKAIAKVHGKASLYRGDGDKLRQSAINALLSVEAAEQMLKDPKLGLLAPFGAVLEHNDVNMTYSGNETAIVADEIGLTNWFGHFPAGSMFWFRQEAMDRLLSIKPNSFDVERGLADGTRAHAVERLFCSVCEDSGFTVGTTGDGAGVKILHQPLAHAKASVPPLPKARVALKDWHTRLLKHAAGEVDHSLPALPPRAIQEQFVGSSMGSAFEEAHEFYATFQAYSNSLSEPMDACDARFLDFGCGWGRFLRYAMNDFPQERLFAVDIDPDIIRVCRESGIPASFHLIDPRGKLPFADNYFSHVMAYSVFTHLPEDLHLSWSAEIVRVLKPGGIFCGTLETRKFLEYIQNLPDGTNYPNDWVRTLATYKPQIKELLRQYDANQFVYLPTGGGGMRTNDIYGEAVVSPAYVETRWGGAKVRAVLDENFWQTVFIVQKL